MSGLSHIDEKGRAVMVDVSGKEETVREARARGEIRMSREAVSAVLKGNVPKGDVLSAARIAGIMAVKRTPDLIPLCHPLLIGQVQIDLKPSMEEGSITAFCGVKLTGRTGAEMEALTGVSVALLTIYDMCKAIDKAMEITGICLLEKTGGKSGHYVRREYEDKDMM